MIEKGEKTALAVFSFSSLMIIILLMTLTFSSITGKVVENIPSNSELNEISEETNSCNNLECEFGCNNGKCINLVTSYTYRKVVGFSEFEKTETKVIETTPLYQPPIQTHELGTINVEKIIDVLKDEKTFFSVSGNEYFIILKESNPTQATFEISGVSQPVTITVAETKSIDLTGNGNNDISIKIRSINIISNKVKISLT